MGIGGSVNFGVSNSKQRCGSQSDESFTGRNGGQDSYFYGYNSRLQQSKFSEAKVNIKQLRSTMCGSDSSVTSNSNSVQYLQQVIEPAVFAAYTSCLELYKAGVQVKQTTGIGARSFAVDIKFTPGQPGATAFLKGVAVSPQGTAFCKVLGCRNGTSTSIVTRSSAALMASLDDKAVDTSGHHHRHQRSLLAVASPPPARQQRPPPPATTSAQQQQKPSSSPPPPPPPPPPASSSSSSDCPTDVSMNLELSPNAVYSLLCELTPGAPADGGYTEVYLSTSVGGTYKGALTRGSNQNQLAVLSQRLAAAETQAAQSAQDVSGLRGLVAAQAALLRNMTAQLEAVLANSTRQAAQLQNLTTQAVAELRNYTETRLKNLTVASAAASGAGGGGSAAAGNSSEVATPQVPRVQVACGGWHTCVVVSGGIKCWGRNDEGLLGQGDTNGYTNAASVPAVMLAPTGAVVAAAGGQYHTCVVFATSSAISCWGRNVFGVLGLGVAGFSRSNATTQWVVDLGPGARVAQLKAGADHNCVLLADERRIKCWGYNGVGNLGLGDTQHRGTGTKDMGANLPDVDLGLRGLTDVKVKDVAVGCSHACALLSDGRVKCWGYNREGQLGLGDTNHRGDQPGEMGTNLPFVDLGTGVVATAISAGCSHTCVVLSDGSLKCWGYNTNGQLGLGDTAHRGDSPGEMGDELPVVDLGPDVRVAAVVCGGGHTCALLANSSAVKCWGENTKGQLGLGDTNHRGDAPGEMGAALPTVSLGPAGGNTRVVALAAGYSHTCAVLAGTNAVKCWGQNDNGQLGLGDTAHRGDGPGEMGASLPAVNYGTFW